jgi:16S rRNA (uracil1498-N3)-methyltransferase
MRPGYCAVEKISSAPAAGEPLTDVRLFVAFSKSDKIELIIQKAVELGCSGIVAFPSKRCVSIPDEKALERRLIRWNKISAEAASQSGRGIIPEVSAAPDLILRSLLPFKSNLAVFFTRRNGIILLNRYYLAADIPPFRLFTGPEGGFDPEEAAAAVNAAA